jgi:hypothetical protein
MYYYYYGEESYGGRHAPADSIGSAKGQIPSGTLVTEVDLRITEFMSTWLFESRSRVSKSGSQTKPLQHKRGKN